MKRLYWPHPNDRDIGGMERFYARMARRGWQLEKRGAFFSRFIRKEPEEVCYRVELASSSGNFGEVQLPPEQIQLYEECGWQYVTGRGLVHLFRAPAGSGEPELYDDPRQQADTLQGLRREARHQLIGACVQTAIYLLLVCLNWSGRFADMRITCLQAPTLVPLALILMGSLLAGALHQVISLGRQYRRMRLGQPLDRRPQWGWRTIQGGFWAAGAVCVAFLVWQAVGTRTLMPVAGQVGPCLVLEQLGEEGELTNLPVREGRESSIRVTPLLGGRWWHGQEIRETGSTQASLFQDVYELSSPQAAAELGPILTETATFGWAMETVEGDGLDWAVCGALEAVAVRGNKAACITLLVPVENDEEQRAALTQALTVLAEQWNNPT